MPTQDGTDPAETYTFSDAKNVSVYSACENQKTAWEVLKFATSEEQDGKLLETTGQMPIRADLEATYPEYFKSHPEYTEFADQASRTVEVPNVPNSVEIWQEFRDEYSAAVIFGQDPGRRGARRRRREDRRARRAVLTRMPETTMATTSAPAASPRRLTTLLGRQPLGILFAAPYAVFLAAIFAYPLGLAVWMSFHDYFFAAPGAQVDRPFVGFENYQAVLSDPDVRQSFVNVGDLPDHQRAADRRALASHSRPPWTGRCRSGRSCGSPTTSRT